REPRPALAKTADYTRRRERVDRRSGDTVSPRDHGLQPATSCRCVTRRLSARVPATGHNTAMSVRFLAGGESGDAWLRALAAAEPDLEVATKDRIDDPDGVEYAIVGRIMPGELAAYPNLAAILSMWAGVEHLLADDTVPVDVPIVRMVEPSLTRGMV